MKELLKRCGEGFQYVPDWLVTPKIIQDTEHDDLGKLVQWRNGYRQHSGVKKQIDMGLIPAAWHLFNTGIGACQNMRK